MHSQLYDRVIAQLDSLVIFMGLRDRRFFDQVTESWDNLGDLGDEASLPASPRDYEQIVLQSALLLGVAYAEAYFADALRQVIRAQPRVLASRKKCVTWEEAVKAGDWESLLNTIIERELLEFTHLAIGGMLEYLRNKFDISLPDVAVLRTVREASVVRNLITHNSATASRELEELNADFQSGQAIVLTAARVHGYGIAGRSVIRELDTQLVTKHRLGATGSLSAGAARGV